MADEAKAKGNTAFSEGKFEEAITHFSRAIELAPANHVLYSNRSASYASLHKYEEALADANKTVELKPDWAKGYSRLGAAYIGLKKYDDAESAYRKGLEHDSTNEALKSGLADAQAAKYKPRGFPGGGPSPFGDIFSSPDLYAKLSQDPKTRAYLQQPDFLKMIQDVQKNPGNFNLYLKDPRMMQVLGVLLGINLSTVSKDDASEDIPDVSPENPVPTSDNASTSSSSRFASESKKEAESDFTEISEDDKEKGAHKLEAVKEKEAGNAAYKKKDFEVAIQHYTKAIELDDEDVSFITNRAAVYLEMGKVRIFIVSTVSLSSQQM